MKIAVLTTDSREHFKDYQNPVPYFGTAPTALLEGFAAIPDVELHVISCHQMPMSSPEKLAPNIFFHGLHVSKSGWMRTFYQGCVAATRAKLRNIRPDLVHGQGSERDCALSAVRSGFPNVLTIHGNMRKVAKALNAFPFSFHWFAARLEGWALRRTRGVICLTRYTQEQVQPLAQQTWIIPNAVSASFFSVKRAPHRRPVLLCVANIAAYKCQNELIRTLDPIAESNEFQLVFVGSVNTRDPYGAEFLELVNRRQWCVYKGFQSGDALREELETAYALLLPSREDNCPMVILEAMAAGVPIAASRIGGIPDLIDDGVNGRLFDPNNSDDVRHVVGKMLAEQEHLQTMAVTGKARAYERHHPKTVALQHVKLYEKVLQSRS